MAKVPVYNSPQIDRAPVDNAKQQVGGISARAFGASDTFREAENLAGTYIKIQEKEGERAAAEEALRAQSNFQREVIGKQNEWRQRQGKNAEGVDKEADAWMAETADKYIKELKDPRAVQIFDQHAMRHRTNMLDWSTGHVTQQREVALDVEINSAKQVAMDAALNDSRPQIVSQSITDIKAKNAFTANRKGYDDVWIQAQNAKDLEKLHGGILQNAMDQDSVGGVQGYLQAHGGEMDASLRAKAESWVHKKVIDETAGSYADELIGSGVSYTEGLAGIRAKYSGDDEEAYVRAFKGRAAEIEQEKNRAERDAADAIIKKVYEGGGYSSLTRKDIEALPPSVAMDVLSKQDKERDNILSGGSRFNSSTNPEKYNEALRAIERGEVKTEVELVGKYGIYITDGDAKTLIKTIDNQKIAPQSEIEDIFAARKSLKGKVEAWDPKDRNEFAAFSKFVNDRVRETSRPQDVLAIGDKWFIEGHGKKDTVWGNDPNTYGEAVMQGRTDFEPKQKIDNSNVEAAAADMLTREGRPLSEKNMRLKMNELLGIK